MSRLRGRIRSAAARKRLNSFRAAGQRYGAAFRQVEAAIGEAEPGELERYFDAHIEGPGLWKWRHYFPIYERHLARFVDKPVRLVEVGIFSGGSLPMWRDYLGSGCLVHGIDIDPRCAAYASDGVCVWIGDQADPAFWARFLDAVPAFDVVIDDGGHEPLQQIATLEAVLPHLSPGGVYLCEDIHGPGHGFHAYLHGLSLNLHPGYVTGPATPFQRAIDSIHLYPYVTVIERRAHCLDELAADRHGTEWAPPEHQAQG